ncbi:MAG: electron transfer flavoprotein subunit alpha/FixB family protein [Acidimicrobiia bacterium]
MSVLVLIDHDRGEAAPASWGALTAGRELASSLGIGLEALVIGAAGAGIAGEAATYGAGVVHVAEHPVLSDYGPDSWAETVVQVVAATGAAVVAAAGTDRGNETLAQAAARMGEPLVVNVTAVAPGEPWRFTRLRWGGSLLERAELTAGVKLITYAPPGVDPEPSPVPGDVRTFTPELDDTHAVTRVVDRVVLTEGMTLATAPVVVGGGRGVGSEDGFASLEELAGLLGGVVGCSRVATNNGWRPHSDQVGQTGTRIAPRLYIACGISGAIQHWVGAMGSKAILAINTDAEANMVTKADFAVIGDLHEVVPALSAEIRARRGD